MGKRSRRLPIADLDQLKAAVDPKVRSQVFGPVFDRAISNRWLTSVGKAVHKLGHEIWPGCELIYDPRIFDGIVRAQTFFHDPVALTTEFWEMLIGLNEIDVNGLVDDGFEFWDHVLAKSSFVFMSALFSNPKADELLDLYHNPQRFRKNPDWFDRDVTCTWQFFEWDDFIHAMNCGMLLGWLYPVVDGTIFLPEDEDFFPRYRRHDLLEAEVPFFYEALFPMDDAVAIGKAIVDHYVPFEGPAGKAILLHGNHEKSLRYSDALRHVIQEPLDTSIEVAVARHLIGQRNHKRVIRTFQLCKFKSWGFSHTDIAREWLDSGQIEPEWAEGRDALENAERQVRRLWSDFHKRHMPKKKASGE